MDMPICWNVPTARWHRASAVLSFAHSRVACGGSTVLTVLPLHATPSPPMVWGLSGCNRASQRPGGLSRSQPAVAPDSDVLLRLLLCVRGATHVVERDRWAGRVDVAVGLVGGCSHGEAAKKKGKDDEQRNDVSGKCPEGQEASECDPGGSRRAGADLLSRGSLTGARSRY